MLKKQGLRENVNVGVCECVCACVCKLELWDGECVCVREGCWVLQGTKMEQL